LPGFLLIAYRDHRGQEKRLRKSWEAYPGYPSFEERDYPEPFRVFNLLKLLNYELHQKLFIKKY